MTDDPHASLRDDVRLLGELLGQTLRELATGYWKLFSRLEIENDDDALDRCFWF
jgi:hypothetical protein